MKAIKKYLAIVLTLVCMISVCSIATVSKAEYAATKFEFGKSYSGHVGVGEKKFYKFTLTKSGKVSFNYDYDGYDNNRFIVFDMAENDMCYEHVGKGAHNIALDLLAGEYYIEIKTYNSYGAIDYALVGEFVSANETKSESYLNKNDTVATATAYTIGDTRKGQLAINDGADVYKVSVKKTGMLNITLDSRIQSSTITVVNSLNKVSYVNENLELGRHKYNLFVPKGTYYITVKKENSKTGTYSFKATLANLPKVAVKSVRKVKGPGLKIAYGRNSKVYGYQIQIANNKKFKSRKTVTLDARYATGSTTVSMKRLVKGKTYYVRVRTYLLDNNSKKYFSAWSANKTITIK